ncbi:MAG: peptidase M15, partial [Actinophytocola sp.]|nr:peptidase M15 [Actinophytocola sp.]
VPAKPLGGDRMADCGLVLPGGAPKRPKKLTAKSWVLSDLDSGEVLAARDPHGRQRPASLIKVLLALVVLDELRPEQIVIANKRDANQECTCIGIVRGGEYAVDDMFTGLLMSSGNDVAHALGSALGGIDEALRKMNAKAKELGALDTRAATTSGLDGPGMSSSSYDMSLIFRHAMRQPAFAKAVRTQQMRFEIKKNKPAITLYNDNQLLRDYRGFLGGKTGFTDDSRHTYVGAAERNGRRLAVVMLRAEQRPIRVSEQAGKLLDYGFALAKRGTAPVGRIVEPKQAPPEQHQVGPLEGFAWAEGAETERAVTPEDAGDTSRDVVVLIILGAALVIAIVLRRKTRR